MKRLMILLFCGIMQYSLSAQILGAFKLSDFGNKGIICKLFLLEENKYYIELSEKISSDMIESFLMSYGTFSLKNNQIILVDLTSKYRMIFYLNKNDVIPEKAIYCLKHKVFQRFIEDPEEWDFLVLCKEELNIIKKNSDRCSLEYFNIKIGKYENDSGYVLEILKKQEYQINYKELIISKGKWSRNKNKLILYDSSLKHQFFGIIDEDKIISNLFPCEYLGRSLYLKH